MPYNSSAFEKQLAKYKQAQAEKAVRDMPRKKYENYGDDPHQVKSRIPVADRGSIKSYALDPVQIMGEGAQTAPVNRDPVIAPIIIRSSRKPFYKRAWFVLLMVTTLPVLAAPVLYKEEMKQLMSVVDTVKTTTGVDPLALKTYTNMVKGNSVAPAPAVPASEPAAVTEAAPTAATSTSRYFVQPSDMEHAVEKAQGVTESVTSQGADYSMKYIEEETKRLNDMAKEFDAKHGR